MTPHRVTHVPGLLCYPSPRLLRPSSHDVPHTGDLQHDEHRGGAVGHRTYPRPASRTMSGPTYGSVSSKWRPVKYAAGRRTNTAPAHHRQRQPTRPSEPPTSAHTQVGTSVGSLSVTLATATSGNATVPLRIAPRSIARDARMPS